MTLGNTGAVIRDYVDTGDHLKIFESFTGEIFGLILGAANTG